jgi:dihydroflavonol-4-reductase
VSRVAVVTGASGFVGGAVARALLAEGYDVRAAVRSRAAAEVVERIRWDDASVRPVPGDVLQLDSLADAFAGADVVIHAAGLVRTCLRDPSPMMRMNVLGTRNAVTAAAAAGAGRLVLTSSAATIGERAGDVGSEDTEHRGWFLSAYERSKAEAEAAAFSLGRGLGLEVVAVNPASVQGPGRADGTARLLAAAARRRWPVAVRTTVSFVDVDDCAAGHVLAAARGRPGERYLLCGATMTTEAVVALVDEIVGRRRRGRSSRWRVTVPPAAIEALADLAESVFGAVRRDPPLCREVAAAVRHGRAYDGSRAARELGLRYTPPERTIARTLDWLASRRREGRDHAAAP